MSVLRKTLFCRSNSINFYPQIPSGLSGIFLTSFQQQLQVWQAQLSYQQKLLLTDQITIQVHSQLSPNDPTLTILDYQFNPVAGINLNVAPYFKGKVVLSGNTVNIAGVTLSLTTYTYSFNFNNFISSLPALPGGIYYLQYTNKYTSEPDIVYYSEPIFISDYLPNTILLQYYYNSNIASKCVIVEQLWNDYETFTDPYTLLFSFRIEGYINKYVPKVINIGYNQQAYQQLQVKTAQVTTFTLNIGEISLGIPYYMLQRITEAMLADMVYIDGTQYLLFNPSSQQSLSDLWKIRDSDISPLVYANTAIVWADEVTQSFDTPLPLPYIIFTEVFADTFS